MYYKNGWNYGFLLRKISEMEKRLPKLIQSQEWDTIEKMLQIPKENWNGVIVKAYNEYVFKVVSGRDDEVKKLPEILRRAVEDMQQRNNEIFSEKNIA